MILQKGLVENDSMAYLTINMKKNLFYPGHFIKAAWYVYKAW